jgi:ParB family chromosome partitioning protein
MAKPARRSPILGAVSSMIGEASGTLVTAGGRFRHSFEIDVAAVSPDPAQARRHFDEAEIAGLAVTMAEQGQLQPILVRRDPEARGRWIIIAGERRWRAAQRNGWVTILAIEHGGDPEVAALIENLQRIDLSPVEEARALQRLIADKGWSQDRAAAAVGKSKGEVSATLGILTLPEALLDKVLTSELALSKNVLVELARVEGEGTRARLMKLAMEGGLTVRAIRDARAQTAPVAVAEERPLFEISRVNATTRHLEGLQGRVAELGGRERAALHRLQAALEALLGEM